jgi:TonB-linked SusC/RagA family outer membrane protein
LTNFGYWQLYRKIVLLLSFILIFSFTGIIAQQKINGVVTATTGSPLSGATVSVIGTNTATVTQADGSFAIIAKTGNVLEITFIGYKTRQVKIEADKTLKIALSESSVNLEEVIVTGYTSQKVKEITGSVSIVKTKDLTSVPAGQVEQMLQGRVAGLNVITSGMPGSPSNVRLHGIGNFGDVTPLYIIDGIQGNINNLNPDDIESLQVLKDAGAYAIYGVRGANGVIVITTRSGKPGRAKISYDFYMGLSVPAKNALELLNPQEMGDLTWIAYKNSGLVGSNGNPIHKFYGNGSWAVLPDYFIAGDNTGLFEGDPLVDPSLYNIDYTLGPIWQIVKTNKAGTDWYDEMFNSAFSQNHSLTVSGANEKNKYLLSLGYLDQEGTVLNTYLKRYTARVNTEFAVLKNIRIGENMQFTYKDNPKSDPRFDFDPRSNGIFGSLLGQPIMPVYDIKGGWAHFQYGGFGDNPIALRTIAKDDKTHYWENFGNVFAETDFLKAFTFRTNFGGNLVNYYSYTYTFDTYQPTSNGLPNNSLIESSGYRRSWTWTNTLKYSKILKNDHHVTALAGTEAISNYNREVGGRKLGFYTNDVNYRFLTNGSPNFGVSNYSFASTSSLFSIFSQVDYGFRDKLFLKGTLRRDGSSVFGPENRYGWFPSVSAAWRMTEEKFMSNIDWLNEFKLRASWGKTGFYGNTDPFNQYTLYGGSIGDAYYDINGTNSPVQGFSAVRLGDPNTGWQEDVVTNIGFESIFWKGKLNATIDYYRKKAKGLLFPITLPDVLGGAIPPNVNVGIIQNTGFDILLGSKGNFSKDWHWDATITFTTYNNIISKLTDLPYFSPTDKPFVRNQVGQPVGSFYGHKIIGIFKNSDEVNNAPAQNGAAPGRFRYLDANYDKMINDDDRVFIGNPNPDFTLGVNLGITYKNFDFTAFFYGSFGNEVVNVPRFYTDFFQIGDNRKSKALLYDSWTPQNTDAKLPVIETDFNFSNVGTYHSYPVEDGSYFRNKLIMLGYTFPKQWLQKMKMDKLRVYLQAVNLFTITNYTGLDPEIPGSSEAFGIDYGNYPAQRQFLFGINLNF